MSKNKWTVTINGADYTLTSEEPRDYLIRVGLYLTEKMDSLSNLQLHYDENQLSVFAGLIITDELFRERARTAELEGRIRELESKLPAEITEE